MDSELQRVLEIHTEGLKKKDFEKWIGMLHDLVYKILGVVVVYMRFCKILPSTLAPSDLAHKKGRFSLILPPLVLRLMLQTPAFTASFNDPQ